MTAEPGRGNAAQLSGSNCPENNRCGPRSIAARLRRQAAARYSGPMTMQPQPLSPMTLPHHCARPGTTPRRAGVARGRLVHRMMLGEPVLLGRDDAGAVFALRDICPHRGMPLSARAIRRARDRMLLPRLALRPRRALHRDPVAGRRAEIRSRPRSRSRAIRRRGARQHLGVFRRRPDGRAAGAGDRRVRRRHCARAWSRPCVSTRRSTMRWSG